MFTASYMSMFVQAPTRMYADTWTHSQLHHGYIAKRSAMIILFICINYSSYIMLVMYNCNVTILRSHQQFHIPGCIPHWMSLIQCLHTWYDNSLQKLKYDIHTKSPLNHTKIKFGTYEYHTSVLQWTGII